MYSIFVSFQQKYLRKFNYIPENDGSEKIASTVDITLALKGLQHMAGIEETGSLLKQVIKLTLRFSQ